MTPKERLIAPAGTETPIAELLPLLAAGEALFERRDGALVARTDGCWTTCNHAHTHRLDSENVQCDDCGFTWGWEA